MVLGEAAVLTSQVALNIAHWLTHCLN